MGSGEGEDRFAESDTGEKDAPTIDSDCMSVLTVVEKNIRLKRIGVFGRPLSSISYCRSSCTFGNSYSSKRGVTANARCRNDYNAERKQESSAYRGGIRQYSQREKH